MKLKLYSTLIILFLFFSNSLEAKPRCDLFYDDVYNTKIYPTDEDIENTVVKDFGIQLLQHWDIKEDKWKVTRNKNGYFIVGAVTNGDLFGSDENQNNKVMPGDVILSINNEDLRKTYDEIEYRGRIGQQYNENQKIRLKLERKLSNKTIKLIEIESVNKEIQYNDYIVDIYFNYINVNEKTGTFDAKIQATYSDMALDEDYQITKSYKKYLAQTVGSDNLEYLQTPTDEQFNNNEVWLYECAFSEKKWTDTNTRYPYYMMRWKNLVKEDKDNIVRSEYKIFGVYDYDEKSLYSFVDFNRNSIVTIKNNFDLKSFPFDRQKLKLILFTEADVRDVRLDFSSWTHIRLNEFVKENDINGWHIRNAITYETLEKYPETEGVMDASVIEITIDRKSGYYIFKIIIPIILILMICWSSCWIHPREIESRLTITIVCLLSLIAYNFVIDSDMPKLEYLTIMDYIILISYIYAAIPNFLSIYSFQMYKRNKKLADKYELIEKKYGMTSYLIIIIMIIIFNVNTSPEFTNSMFSWAAMR